MFVSVKDDSAILKCRYQEKELIKAIGDYKFDRVSSSWIFPLKKLVDIIDNLNIKYDPETKTIYDRLRNDRHKQHQKINLANKIKSVPQTVEEILNDKFDGMNLSMYYQHQKKAIALASLFGSYALFMETGTGKSVCAIKLIEYWKVPAMIVAPLTTLESVWVKEIEKWAPHLKKVILWNNLKAFNLNFDVYIINYAQFKIMSKKSEVPIERKIQCLVIDESSCCKNPRSEISKAIISYKDKIKYKLCLTGTPAPNNLLEYWGQLAFINDSLLGSNFYKFRNTFFYSTGFGGYLYRPMKGAKEAIIENVSKQAFSVKKEDCLDLPDRVYETRYVYMDEVQKKAYEMMKKENILEFQGNITLAANELAKIMKLRQVTSGWSINTEGIPIFISDTKVNALKELLEEISEDKQVIIWVNFHFEIHRLKEVFKDECNVLYGELSQKEKQKNIEDFQNKKYRILIAHPLSGGMGINFQQCSYAIWYSLNYSQEQYSQANDRIYRIGQQNKVTYFILLAKDSIDEVIYRVLDKKADLMEECMKLLKN